MNFAEAFGVIVQERRLSLDLLQNELAQRLGVKRNFIGLLESGSLPALDAYKEQVAKALGCPLKNLEEAAKRVLADANADQA